VNVHLLVTVCRRATRFGIILAWCSKGIIVHEAHVHIRSGNTEPACRLNLPSENIKVYRDFFLQCSFSPLPITRKSMILELFTLLCVVVAVIILAVVLTVVVVPPKYIIVTEPIWRAAKGTALIVRESGWHVIKPWAEQYLYLTINGVTSKCIPAFEKQMGPRSRSAPRRCRLQGRYGGRSQYHVSDASGPGLGQF
jgi:hypothetical protein